jgi:hypothetical protein
MHGVNSDSGPGPSPPTPHASCSFARSLVRDPLPDVGGATPDGDSFGFGFSQKPDSFAVDQLQLREFDSNDTAFVERGANDLQIFRPDLTADGKDQTVFRRNVVDSARHRFASPLVRSLEWQTECHSQVTEKKKRPSRLTTGEFGGSGECGEFGETGGSSAKLELRLVDTQRLDAMVQRGWWNAKPRSGS